LMFAIHAPLHRRGRGWVRRSLSGRLECQLNRGPSSIGILHDLVRPKPQDAPAFLLHSPRSSGIGLDLGGVVFPIDFDHQFPGDRGEIREIWTDGMLPTKLSVNHAAVSQHLPANALGTTTFPTQFACSFDAAVAHAPSPNLSPFGGEEHDI